MTFVYDNKKSGTYAEFELFNLDATHSDSQLLDDVMSLIKTFDDSVGVSLPKELLVLLTDDELDFFLLAAYNEEYCNAIEQMLYIVKENTNVIDEHGLIYKVEYVGKYKTVVSLESLTSLSLFNVDNKEIHEGRISLRTSKKESCLQTV